LAEESGKEVRGENWTGEGFSSGAAPPDETAFKPGDDRSEGGFSFRKLFSDLAIYSSGSLLIKGMSLISAPIFTRLFDPSQYGAWSFINVMAAFLTGILMLGGDNAYTRFFFQCKNEAEKRVLSSTWFSFLALWSLLLLIAVLPFSGVLADWLLGEEDYRAAMAIGFISSPLLMLNLILSQALRNRFRAGAFSALNVSTAALTLGLAVYFVLGFDLGVAGALLGAAAAALIMIPVRLYFIRDLLTFKISVPFLKKLLAFGLPLVPMNVAFWLFSNADRLMLARLADLGAVGLYSIAAAMAAVLMLLQTAVGQSWLPHAVKVYEEDRELAATVFKRTMVFLLAASGFVITGFVALAQEVLFILVPPDYYASFIAIPFLAAGFLFFTSAQVSAVGIMVKNKTVYIMLACWLVAAINLGLNSLLIPQFEIAGAGAATGLSYILFAALYFLISRRLWPVDYPFKTLAALLVIPLFAVFMIALLALYGPGLYYSFALKLVVLLLTGLALLYLVSLAENFGFKEMIKMVPKLFKKDRS